MFYIIIHPVADKTRTAFRAPGVEVRGQMEGLMLFFGITAQECDPRFPESWSQLLTAGANGLPMVGPKNP